MAVNALKVTIQPAGTCHLDCRYSYSVPDSPKTLAPDVPRHALEASAAYVAGRGFDGLHCVWPGGEPILAGIRRFEQVFPAASELALPLRHFVRTNALLLDDDYCRLFRDAEVCVGIGIDGPREIHDAFRVSLGGAPAHWLVMDAIALLGKHGVLFGCAAVVSRARLGRAQEVYGFFRALGSGFRIRPVIPGRHSLDPACQVERAEYGAALLRFFDAWIAPDPVPVNVSPLDSYVAAAASGEPAECPRQQSCADGTLGIKSDGTATIRGRFRDTPPGRLGSSSAAELPAAPTCAAWQARTSLLKACHACVNWPICNGGCPHNALAFGLERTARDPFCPACKAVLAHIRAALGAGATV